MSEFGPEYPYGQHTRRQRRNVNELLDRLEREFQERHGAVPPTPQPTEQPYTPSSHIPERVLSTERDIERNSRIELRSRTAAIEKARHDRPARASLGLADKYKKVPVNARRGMAVGAAALSIVAAGSILTPNDDPRFANVDYAELTDIEMSDVRVSFANVPIYYGIGVGDDTSSVPFYISDDTEVTGNRTIDASDIQSLMYPKISSSEAAPDNKDQPLEQRLPSLYYTNNLETSVHRIRSDAVQIVDGRVQVDRSAFSIVAVDYPPGDINAPEDARIDYEPIVIDAEGIDGESVSKKSLDNLNSLFDADPDTEGSQPHPAIVRAIGYLAQEVVSSREWDCYKDLRTTADKLIRADVDRLVEAQLEDSFNANRKVKFINDYQTPAQFYETSTLEGNAEKALETDSFIIDKNKLTDGAEVSCKIVTPSKVEKGDA